MFLVLLCHPSSLGSASMPRFAQLIGDGMKARGHQVQYWTSSSRFGQLPGPAVAKKWLGYIDQFLLFPAAMKRRLASIPSDALFVVTDQALGMWVPSIQARPHIIHCHDFLAQRSALGEFPENPVGWTGQCYQELIRRGYQQGINFVSVSKKTQADLHRFLLHPPKQSGVLYNCLNYPFARLDRTAALAGLPAGSKVELQKGYLLHVGGNQWYKNRSGVVAIYAAYCAKQENPLPLVMVGPQPGEKVSAQAAAVPAGGKVVFLQNVSAPELNALYSASNALLFPSLEEGFGWPIVEAQASGTLAITTDQAPMTEVGGSAALYLPRRPVDSHQQGPWAADCARRVATALAFRPAERQRRIQDGFKNAARFGQREFLDRLETLYRKLAPSSARPVAAPLS